MRFVKGTGQRKGIYKDLATPPPSLNSAIEERLLRESVWAESRVCIVLYIPVDNR